MNETTEHVAPEWAAFRRWYFLIAALLAALLLLLWLLGYGPGGSACKLPAAPTTAVTAAPVVVAPAPPAPAVAASVAAPAAVVAAPVAAAAAVVATTPAAAVALPPAARVYFGLNQTALPADVNATLADVVSYLKANSGAKALLSGFHDPSGNAAQNAELALNRARTVRSQLEMLGIAKDRVVMQKPEATTGTGAPREARRVEVSVQAP